MSDVLFPRFAVFYCQPREPMPFPPPPDRVVQAELARRLGEIGEHAAEVGRRRSLILSPAASRLWDQIFRQMSQDQRRARGPEAPMLARLPLHVMKLACLYSLQAFESQITSEASGLATHIGAYWLRTCTRAATATQRAPVARIEEKIVQALESLPDGQVLTASQIHHLVSGRIKAEDLRRSLDSLVALGVLEMIQLTTSRGRTVCGYKLSAAD